MTELFVLALSGFLYGFIGAFVFTKIADTLDEQLGLNTHQFRVMARFSQKRIMLRIYVIYGLIIVLWPLVAGVLGIAYAYLWWQDYVH